VIVGAAFNSRIMAAPAEPRTSPALRTIRCARRA
jgi:hypothetical protein